MKLFLKLVITFIAFTIIGTLTHELGHYSAAKLLGLKPNLHYQSVSLQLSSIDIELDKIYGLYQKEINSKQDFPAKKRFDELVGIETKNDFIHRAAGPLQTTLTGSIGFILLFVYRKKIFATQKLNVKQWLLVFCSLFWLREVFNTTMAICSFIIFKDNDFGGDEFILSKHCALPSFTIPIITAIIGIVICLIVIFKFIPTKKRKIFIGAGLVGGTIGFGLWMYILGPILIP
jgi:small-conductance mechanosensitive channel